MSVAYSHWVDGPNDQGEASDGAIESLGLAVLLGNSPTTADGKLVNDDEIGNAAPGVPAPFPAILGLPKSSPKATQDHNDIGNNGNLDGIQSGYGRRIYYSFQYEFL